MITSLFIKNFILIDELNIDFEKGFSTICGETGAGKSIILKAIEVVLGGKGSKELIKYGEEKSLIEATFENSSKIEIDIQDQIEILDNELVISREITPSGSKYRVNGALVNLEYIKSIGEKLIDIHTQHQTYTFLNKKNHIVFLDDYISIIDDEFSNNFQSFQNYYSELIQIKNQISKIEENNAETIRKIDFLKFQINEIENLALEQYEEENLREELEKLSNIEDIKETSYKAFWSLMGDENSIISGLGNVEGLISYLNNKDKTLENTLNEFYEGYENLKACANDLRNYTENLKNNPERLDNINFRLSEIEQLKRKYGNNLFEALDDFKKELSEIEISETQLSELKEKANKLDKETIELSKYLKAKRKEHAEILSKKVVECLSNLELSNAKFEIKSEDKEMNVNGTDDIEFMLSANLSSPLLPIQKAASGGELSRIMLALKAVFSDLNIFQTLILDEIDTGISGKTSQAVANLISELSNKTQIIAITHQPIIASRARNIYWVQKSQVDNSTKIEITKNKIENSDKILAQMASGNISQMSLDFAKNLINN